MYKNLILISTLAAAILLGGCREITVSTTINKDGSFTRSMIVRGDSGSLYNSGLPFPIDDSWSKNLVMDSSESDKYILEYQKTFRDMAEFQKYMGSDSSWMTSLKRNTEVVKSFGFFYSYITFREVYQAANPFKSLNPKDYLSESDLLYLQDVFPLLSTADSVRKEASEEKMEEFLIMAVANEISLTLENGIGQLEKVNISKQEVLAYQDSLYQQVKDWSFDSTATFIDMYAHWTGKENFLQLHQIEPPLFDSLDSKMQLFEKVLMMEEYTQVVQMPGLISQTNSLSINGNTVSWQVKPELFLMTDYEMLVESRIVNYWAFYLSGGMVVLLFISLLIRIQKK